MRRPAKVEHSELDKAIWAAATDWSWVMPPLVLFVYKVLTHAWVLNVVVHGYGIASSSR